MSQKPTPSGSLPIYSMNAPLLERFDYDGSGNVIYHGIAITGSATSAAAWFIEKFTYSGSNVTIRQMANGSDLANQIWDNRTLLTYS